MASDRRTGTPRLLLTLLVACVALSSHCAAANIVLLPTLLNASFVFDGQTADLAQQFYRRYALNELAAQLNSSLVLRSLPEAITQRLARSNVSIATFAQLPGLLQRAVVWDSGFVLTEASASSSAKFVRVLTTQGRAMTDIVVSRQELLTAITTATEQCALTQCNQPRTSNIDSEPAFKTFECGCETLSRVSKCAVAVDGELESTSSPPSTLLWSTGADPEAIPVPAIAENRCQPRANDSNGGSSAKTVFSIHTATQDSRTSCSGTQFESLAIPCVRLSTLDSAARGNMKEPKTSSWVDVWLKAEAELEPQSSRSTASTSTMPRPSANSSSSSSGSKEPKATATTPLSTGGDDDSTTAHSSFKMVLLIPIVMGSLFVIALIGLFAIRYTGPQHRLQSHRGVTASSSIDVSALLSPTSKDYL